MKIRTNYDLMYEIALAKKGFTLKSCSQKVLVSTAINMCIYTPYIVIDGTSPAEILEFFNWILVVSTATNGATEMYFSHHTKSRAFNELRALVTQLGNIFIDTTPEMLLEARRYKTEFKLNFEKFPPKLEEHKYIMVPVNNDWGNNERSLHQEHVIGTRDYDYSYGEPKKEKQYSYQMKRVINK